MAEGLNGTIVNSIGTCGTAAIALPSTKSVGRVTWIAYNDGTATVYLGGSGVTSSTGIPVAGTSYSPAMDLGNALIYGITAAGAGTVRVFEIS
jgi:hypothetical protein